MWSSTLTRIVASLTVAAGLPAGVAAEQPAVTASSSASTGDSAAVRRAKAVDALFTRWHTPDSPGASVAVIYDGAVVHAKGYGMASLEHGVPNQPHTVFDIASVSKQFGAFAIALLEADGRLSLDDDVRKYVPELPDFGHVITIRHLVHHTSGLRDWPGTLRMGGWNYEDVMSFEQILRMAYNQKTLNFKPNDEHAYSNTGYNVLAEVVQRVSGQSFREFTDQRIFKPLGMSRTHFHDDHREVVRDMAESYSPDSRRGYLHVTSNLTALASSSLFTTVEDLAKWVGNFETGTAGGRRVIDGMHRRGVLNAGDTIPYAFGQSKGQYRGLETWSHGGSWAGYRSVLTRFPAQRFAVIILGNTSDMAPGALANQIADIYLGDKLGQAVAQSSTPSPAREQTAPWNPTAAELREFVGEYRSDELETSWHIRLVDGKLVSSHFRRGDSPFVPAGKDQFRSQGPGGEVTFQRDRRGKITGFVSNQVRIRHFLFRRVGS